MLDYFKLIRALQTDQYDDFTVKELKQKFDTEPDNDIDAGIMSHAGIGLMLPGYAKDMLNNLSVALAGHPMVLICDSPEFVSKSPKSQIITNELLIKSFKTEDVQCTINGFEENVKKDKKQQEKFRSRNYKR